MTFLSILGRFLVVYTPSIYTGHRPSRANTNSETGQVTTMDMKGCICHFLKWQIHPFIIRVTRYNISISSLFLSA